jgi:eukaryotic-like serine/threonine-protein kinase
VVGTVTARGEVLRRLAPIFRDRDEIASATDLGTLIDVALEGPPARSCCARRRPRS